MNLKSYQDVKMEFHLWGRNANGSNDIHKVVNKHPPPDYGHDFDFHLPNHHKKQSLAHCLRL